ncbi:hypothetical protein [Pseudoxanthomonas sp. UTMC 1351]|uniref:hypothetical protein n=1 Tax=Pseudoxanthomonas sp. UTMC 1351 TaxID=2695853 RepID=UPI0034CD2CBD
MSRVVHRLMLGTAMLCAVFSGHASDLAAIEISPSLPGAEHVFSGWRQAAPVPRTQQVPLEVGDEVYGALLRLTPASAGSEYRVRVQFETSLAVGDDGPHIDLVDWKHCVSEWRPADSAGLHAFILPSPTEQESGCFPSARATEIKVATQAALVRAGMEDSAPHWLGLLASVKQAGDQPTYVGISKVRVQVETLRKGQWVEVTTVEFLVPLGC